MKKVRYLARTRDKGTIFTPTKDFKLDCYVDADFAGLNGREPQDNHKCKIKNWVYPVFFCGCPLFWKSQLRAQPILQPNEKCWMQMVESPTFYVLFVCGHASCLAQHKLRKLPGSDEIKHVYGIGVCVMRTCCIHFGKTLMCAREHRLQMEREEARQRNTV